MPSRIFARLIPLAALAPLLGACGNDLGEHDYRQRFPLTASKREAVATVAAPIAGQPLSLPDRASLDQLSREHQRRGAGPVVVTVGAEDGESGKAAAQTLADSVLAGLGLPVGEVETRIVGGGNPRPGVAVVTVPIWGADLPQCGEWQWEPNADFGNRDMSNNFGCATQRNLGLMIQNPADLVRPRDASGRDGNRAVDVLDKYRKGAATTSAKEDVSGSSATNIGK